MQCVFFELYSGFSHIGQKCSRVRSAIINLAFECAIHFKFNNSKSKFFRRQRHKCTGGGGEKKNSSTHS